MNIPLVKTSLFAARQIDLLAFLRKTVWVGITVVSVLYSIEGSKDNLLGMKGAFDTWVYIYLNFGSFILGILAGAAILIRKPKSWMAFATAVMLVTFTATDYGIRFWYKLFTGIPFSMARTDGIVSTNPYTISLFFNVLYLALLTTSLAYVLLAFPEEKLHSRRERWFFHLLVGGEAFSIAVMGGMFLLVIFHYLSSDDLYSVYALLDELKSLLLIGLVVWQIARLQGITDPVQRQQIKWMMPSLIGMTFCYALGVLLLLGFNQQFIPVWVFLAGLVFTYGFVFTLLIAIVKYRFWDMGLFYNKALIYSIVTGILTVLGVAGGYLLEFYAKEYLHPGTQLSLAWILLPLAALINPIWHGVQSTVDHYLKPEEIDFSSAMVELAPEAQLMLSSQDILRILVRQSIEQLDLANAAIHLRQPDGQLVQREQAGLSPSLPSIRLEEQARLQLEKGEVVTPAEPSSYSLLIPLVVKRGVKTQFLGILALGRRNSGEGYPTSVLKGLKKLGCEAGKAIYISELREHLGRDISDRLAAIERSLSALNKTAKA